MKRAAFILVSVFAFSMVAGQVMSASIGTQVLKGAAIGFAVTKVAKPLDKFINTITLRNGVQTKLATKVVPILSVGEKGYVGGAQVCGPSSEIAKVAVVFEYEKNFSNNNYRAKILLPSASLNPLKLQRVAKVGVSAVIDVSLNGSLKYHTVGTGFKTGDVIRGAAVLIAVKNYGDTINKGLNTITFNPGVATRVVPMASIGEKMYLGAGQISASSLTINKVKALWQYEDLFASGQFRVKVLVPTTSTNPLEMKRVDGAGVTAIVDMALSQQKDVQSDDRNRSNTTLGRSGKDDDDDQDEDRYDKGNGRHDNGKHKGWYIGKHKGWDKNGKGK